MTIAPTTYQSACRQPLAKLYVPSKAQPPLTSRARAIGTAPPAMSGSGPPSKTRSRASLLARGTMIAAFPAASVPTQPVDPVLRRELLGDGDDRLRSELVASELGGHRHPENARGAECLDDLGGQPSVLLLLGGALTNERGQHADSLERAADRGLCHADLPSRIFQPTAAIRVRSRARRHGSRCAPS